MGFMLIVRLRGGSAAGAEVEDGHADGEAVGDLVEDDAAGGVGDLAVDLDAAVDRAGMHDEGVGLEPRGALLGEAEEGGVFAEAGEVFLALALVLDAQEVDDVDLGQDGVDVVRDADAQLLELARDERAGADERDARAELEQRPDVRAGDAAEEDVADDGDVEAGDAAEALADGEDVEQRLGGMLVRAVAGVDDAGLEPLGEEVRRAGAGVAQDDDIGVQRLEVARGVLERLALGEAGGAGGDIDDVGAEAEGGELEGGAGAGARLDEEIDQRFAAQGRDFFDLARADLLEGGGGVEDEDDFLRR